MTDRITSPSSRTTSMTELVSVCKEMLELEVNWPGIAYAHELSARAHAAVNAIESLTGEGDLGEPPTSLAWKEGSTAPEDGTEIIVGVAYRYALYKPAGQRQMRARGRWQIMGEYGWENAAKPERWLCTLLQASEARGSSTPSPSEDELREELAAALRNVQVLISEAAATGFNWKSGDWPDKLFHSQQRTSAVLGKYKAAILHRTHASGETELEAAGNGRGLR